MEALHQAVMVDELLRWLQPPKADALMVDCTLGEGGHAAAFLAAWPALRYLGLDADGSIQSRARERLAAFSGRIEFRLGWFDELLASMLAESIPGKLGQPDLILFDLGISMYHFAASGRGFSYGKDEPLDMRLRGEEGPSAADLVNGETETALARIIFEFGEERLARRIAHGIVEARRVAPIRSSARLEEVVYAAVPASYRHGRIHPATRTFQALRISVNDELGRAARGIATACRLVAAGGSIGVISFHSLEDRIVKLIFKALAGRAGGQELPDAAKPILAASLPADPASAEFRLAFSKPLVPRDGEVSANAAARSAKLRVIQRLPRGQGSEVAA